MYRLIPSIFSEKEHVDIKETINQYKDDLPYPLLVNKECSKWKSLWKSADKDGRPTSVAQAKKPFDKDVSNH